jgi:hypothetical protein
MPNCSPFSWPWTSRFWSIGLVSMVSGMYFCRDCSAPAAPYWPIRGASMLITSGAFPPAIWVASLSQYSAVAVPSNTIFTFGWLEVYWSASLLRRPSLVGSP